MLHNKGNTIPYYGEDLSDYVTSLAFINRFLILCHYIVFFKVLILKDFKFFTTNLLLLKAKI